MSNLVCPECGSTKVRKDSEKGEVVCQQCGLIVSEDEMDFGKEWRTFDGDGFEDSARTGSPMKYVKLNKGLVTMIDRRGSDSRGNKLSSKSKAQMYRLIKWHKRASISSSMQRNLSIALTELRRVASYLNIPEQLVEAAALLYRKTVKKGLIRGRLIEAVVAAVLYTVCRTYQVPRTLNEMAEASGLTKKEIGRTYRFLVRELKLEVPLTNPIHYIPRFASELNLSGEVQEEGRKILEDAIGKGLISGRGPTGVAAAAVYIAGLLKGERRTQKEVANVAGVTEVTIRNRYRELKKRLDIEVSA
ncbi:MAG: transcription initiation factor IIB [Candidatus Iainarchaeum archaeon]|uniref:Transcription initiation factor IIB n=1 Tax=Candidatus Iainarchaeum sp. TaxID=3101447 RepID=A0A7T9I1D2_9ARCH|nr:MAG: transcription initiation factor IIB [Candidatus Diapherotrites archaeon]